jgi:hypothetical protein
MYTPDSGSVVEQPRRPIKFSKQLFMVQFFVKIPLKYFPLFISFCCNYLKPISIFVETKDKTKKIMKVTIELSEAEAKGLKEYLKDLDGIRASKSDIQQHIQGIVNAVLNAPQEAVSNYIEGFKK